MISFWRKKMISVKSTENDYVTRMKRARGIVMPLILAVRSAKRAAWRAGRSPSIVCLGARQEELLWDYAEVRCEIGLTERLEGLRIVWVDCPDYIAVYEERPGGWF